MEGMPSQPDRRTVLRAAAWSAPAVAVATAAPAFATSPAAPVLTFDTLNLFGADYTGGDPTRLESQVQVQNVYAATSPTLTSLSLTVLYPDSRTSGGAPTNVSGSGWAFAGAAHSGTNWVYTFAYAGSVGPGASTSTLDYRVPLTDASPGTIAITGTALAAGGSISQGATYKLK
jgi:hypothetical protein